LKPGWEHGRRSIDTTTLDASTVRAVERIERVGVHLIREAVHVHVDVILILIEITERVAQLTQLVGYAYVRHPASP